MSRTPEITGFDGESKGNTEPSEEEQFYIYRVPPERREEVIRTRTEILKGLYKLEQQGIFKRPEPGQPTMPLSELAERLKSYPALYAHFLETLTLKEFAEIGGIDIETLQPIRPTKSPNIIQRAARGMGNILHRKS